MKLHTLTLLTLTALATLVALPGTAATDPSTDTATATHDGPGGRHRGGPMGGGMRGGPMGGGMRGDPAERLENLDTNNDDKISKEEFLAPQLDRLDDMFSRRDDNGDGLLAEGEGRPQRADRGGRGGERGQRGGRMQRADIDRDAVLACVQKQVPGFDPPELADRDDGDDNFADADTNGDGSLSLSELTAATTARADAQFAKLDTNGDGFITNTETAARQDEREAVAAAMRDCTKAQLGN